jgi:hypothetical protein
MIALTPVQPEIIAQGISGLPPLAFVIKASKDPAHKHEKSDPSGISWSLEPDKCDSSTQSSIDARYHVKTCATLQ